MKPPEELVLEAERLEMDGCEQEAFRVWKNLSVKYRDPDALFRLPFRTVGKKAWRA